MKANNTEIIEMDSSQKQGEPKMESTDNNYPCPFCPKYYRIVDTCGNLETRQKRIGRKRKKLKEVKDKLLEELKHIKNRKQHQHQRLKHLDSQLSNEVREELISMMWEGWIDELSRRADQYNTKCIALNRKIDNLKQEMTTWNDEYGEFFNWQDRLSQEGKPFFDTSGRWDKHVLDALMYASAYLYEDIEKLEKQRLKSINID